MPKEERAELSERAKQALKEGYEHNVDQPQHMLPIILSTYIGNATGEHYAASQVKWALGRMFRSGEVVDHSGATRQGWMPYNVRGRDADEPAPFVVASSSTAVQADQHPYPGDQETGAFSLDDYSPPSKHYRAPSSPGSAVPHGLLFLRNFDNKFINAHDVKPDSRYGYVDRAGRPVKAIDPNDYDNQGNPLRH